MTEQVTEQAMRKPERPPAGGEGPAIAFEAEAACALRAVYEGSLICGERGVDPPAVTFKESPRDVVTEIDRRIEHTIRRHLEPCGHPVLGEEGCGPNAVFPPVDDQPVWVVDPLDGTANFVSGMPWFAVAAGLWVGGDFVLGAVALPASRELLFTHGVRGAFLNGRPLSRPGRESPFAQALIAAGFAGHVPDPEQRRRQYALFGRINDQSRGALRLGSTIANICQVAAGRLQGAYGLGVRVWDAAAALAIARAAGYTVRWRLDPQDPTRLDFVVGTAAVVTAINAAMAETGAAAALETPESETQA